MENNKFFTVLSYAAAIMAVGMYVSYIPQIADNLAGHKGNPIQPLVAAINCTLFANAPGIIFGLIAFLTAL